MYVFQFDRNEKRTARSFHRFIRENSVELLDKMIVYYRQPILRIQHCRVGHHPLPLRPLPRPPMPPTVEPVHVLHAPTFTDLSDFFTTTEENFFDGQTLTNRRSSQNRSNRIRQQQYSTVKFTY